MSNFLKLKGKVIQINEVFLNETQLLYKWEITE